MADIYKDLAAFFDSFPQRFLKDSKQGQKVIRQIIEPDEAQMIMNFQKILSPLS